MDYAIVLGITAFAGLVCGCVVTWLIAQQKITALTVRAHTAEATITAERTASEAVLTAERAVHADQQLTEQRVRDTFAQLSSEALRASTDQLLHLAHERMQTQQQGAKSDIASLIDPLRMVLDQQREHIQRIEAAREHAYGSIETQLRRMTTDQERLTQETANLVKALRQPHVRGRWGEIQLRQVVELAGMSAHCDFVEQQSITSENERIRPDMQVRLPNQRVLVIDAKAPLSAYLEALEAPDDATRLEQFRTHAKQIRTHVNDMAKRTYQQTIDGAHTFLILFIPGEVFFNAALEHDKELLEYALSKDIILATPTTLIALLKAVALGWNEQRLAKDAQYIKDEGEKIYRHLSKVVEYTAEVGKGLHRSVESYNKLVGSVEKNLLSSARRLSELEVATTAVGELVTLEDTIRPFTKAELMPKLD